MQVIENWADIRGRVSSVGGDAPPRFVRVCIDVESIDEVPPYPNLFHDESTLEVLLPEGTNVETGSAITLRVERTPRGNFARE